jgi:phage terminase large subunit-like protein
MKIRRMRNYGNGLILPWDRFSPLTRSGKIFETAKNDPVDLQNFLRFRLNIPIKSLSRWMPMNEWDQCSAKPDLESLRGRTCYGGLDLASKIDLASFVMVFPLFWRVKPGTLL